MSRMMRACTASLCALCIGGVPGTAVATASPEAPEEASVEGVDEPPALDGPSLNERATKAFEEGRYDDAIALFEREYERTQQSNCLYNIGRVYEQKGELDQALRYYRRFVGRAGVDLEARETTIERIAVLKQALDEAGLEEPPKVELTPVPVPVPPPPEDAEPEDADAPDGRRRQRVRIAGYALLGIGGAGLLAGGVLAGLALRQSTDARNQEFVDEAERRQDDARRLALGADASLIAGGTVAAAGLIMVLTTLRRKKDGTSDDATTRVEVAPYRDRRSAGLTVAGRF